jgi:hypothetical protein
MNSFLAAACLTVGFVSIARAQPPAPPREAPPVCTRAELRVAADLYVAAQKAGNVSKLAFADNVVFRENMADVAKDAGLWNTPLPIALSRTFVDAARCRTFTELVVTEGDHQYVLGTRLYVDQRKITRIDSLVSDEGDWLFNANAYLKYSKAENWKAPNAEQRVSAQELINAANSYLDLFSDKFVKAPWGVPCARLEGGAYTNPEGKADASCEVGIPPGVLYIVNRDYVVDEVAGVVNVFCRFGNSATGMPDSHTFRLVNGKITNVHTISVNLNPDAPSPQADDNGAIVRTGS